MPFLRFGAMYLNLDHVKVIQLSNEMKPCLKAILTDGMKIEITDSDYFKETRQDVIDQLNQQCEWPDESGVDLPKNL